jgi:sialic acid synthase SpsE
MLGRRDFRLSCCAASELPAGHVLRSDDITFIRPATGLPPRAVDWIVGRTLRTSLSAGAVLKPEDLA